MEEFLTYSDWKDKFGEKFKEPKYTSGRRACGAVDVDRCQKIAQGKNSKIKERNNNGYAEYLKEYSANNDLSQVSGMDSFNSDKFMNLIFFVRENDGTERAEILIEKSGRFIKNENGKWSLKSV